MKKQGQISGAYGVGQDVQSITVDFDPPITVSEMLLLMELGNMVEVEFEEAVVE